MSPILINGELRDTPVVAPLRQAQDDKGLSGQI